MFEIEPKRDSRKCTFKSSITKRLPQYEAVFTVCIGSLAAGAVIGWTGNISEDMKLLSYNGIEINDDSLGWIGSLVTLGMMVSCIPIGKLCDIIGRKSTMLSVTIFFITGWLLILYANSLSMMYIGRFLTGMAAGAFIVAAPIYTTEISEKEIRGALGNCLELFLTIGILLACVTPKIVNMKAHTYILSALPIVFAALFAFQPESPFFRLQQKQDADAKTALIRLRGNHSNVDTELNDMKKTEELITIRQSLKMKGTQKAIIASFGLMFFQAMTGIYALVFYTDTIVESSGTEIDRKTATIILGLVQTVSAVLSCVFADRFPRRTLLIYSNFLIAVSLAVLGLFTTIVDRKLVNENTISTLNFVPLLCLILFMAIYSFAMGPLPWVINAELFPIEIKGPATGATATFNSFVSFVTAKLFFDIKNSIGGDANYYIFAGSTFIGVAFIYFYLPETKGKTLKQIQMELNQ